MRQHNRLWLELAQNRQVRDSKKAVKCLRKDPNDFARKLFHGATPAEGPAFSAKVAEAFFPKAYRDEVRSHSYVPLDGQPRPVQPSIPFNMEPPSWQEITRSVRRKRNGASPGLDALTYVLFKKCPAILSLAPRLFSMIWLSRAVPADWAVAYTILLAKSDNLHDPSEFRPITLRVISCQLGGSILKGIDGCTGRSWPSKGT